MDLRVDDAAMKSLVAKSIVDSLSPEAREQLITSAVTQTLTKPEEGRGYSSDKRSPLQRAFDGAVVQVASKYAEEIVATDEKFKSQIEGLFADVAKKLFDSDSRDEMVSALADVIRKAITKERY